MPLAPNAVMLDEALKRELAALANEFETARFLEKDPAQFMHRFCEPREQEAAAFVAANLAFGRREQILQHVELILAECGRSPCAWILGGGYERFFSGGASSFYRMYSHDDMRLFFGAFRSILQEYGSLGACAMRLRKDSGGGYLHSLISELFPKDCALIPHTKNSAAKRLNMFLRWMARQNSPVDLGLWTWLGADELLIPLDTHVMQQSVRLGLLSRTASGGIPAANLRTAERLTELARQVFPGDPARLDFALFGLGAEGRKEPD